MKNIIQQAHISELMDAIVSVRFTNLDKLISFCNQLLELAETKHHTYGIAYANLYLFDAYYSSGKQEKARVYLVRTQSLCSDYHYEDLLMIFHNIAGLYYQDLFDEHSAVQHYMKGLELAQKYHDPVIESKIYNNLGISFRRRYENSSALYYFKQAYHTIKPYLCEEVKGTAVGFLCNLAEIYQATNLKEDSLATLLTAQELFVDSSYCYYQLNAAWCAHYATFDEKEKSIHLIHQLLEDGLAEFEHVHFVTSVYFELFDKMLLIDCQELALRFLQLLSPCCTVKNIGDYYNYLVRKMQYHERYGSQMDCNRAYEEFYEISAKRNKIDNDLRVQNVLSKIELSQALFERRNLRVEKDQLEKASHIDELTQLYNRRYISKVQTKVMMGDGDITIGIIMLDIDYFKEYNDFYGHFKGDEALRAVADALRAYVKEDIYCCRYGGDEFLVLCVNQSDHNILHYIEQVQAILAKQQIIHEKSEIAPYVTLSIGYSNAKVNDGNSIELMVTLADEALYQAKKDGRNCYRRKQPNEE